MSVTRPDLDDEAVEKQISAKKIERFRPGHADYAGTLKYGHQDVRDVLERASARETAARVAAGAFARLLLRALDIETGAHVIAIGKVASTLDSSDLSISAIEQLISESDVFCADPESAEKMRAAIKQALMDGDSLGGRIEVLADNLPVGLGSYTQWDRKLDGQLAQALMSIQAIKAVEIGDGIESSGLVGTSVHDALHPSATDKENSSQLPVRRQTNHAGGIEGGMTNGERLLVRAYMKPIPTLKTGLPSVSYPEFEASRAHYERSDVCAVPAASVVAKAMVCLTLANSIIDKFAGDSMRELSASLNEYRRYCRSL
jgi:chorismate synthase